MGGFRVHIIFQNIKEGGERGNHENRMLCSHNQNPPTSPPPQPPFAHPGYTQSLVIIVYHKRNFLSTLPLTIFDVLNMLLQAKSPYK